MPPGTRRSMAAATRSSWAGGCSAHDYAGTTTVLNVGNGYLGVYNASGNPNSYAFTDLTVQTSAAVNVVVHDATTNILLASSHNRDTTGKPLVGLPDVNPGEVPAAAAVGRIRLTYQIHLVDHYVEASPTFVVALSGLEGKSGEATFRITKGYQQDARLQVISSTGNVFLTSAGLSRSGPDPFQVVVGFTLAGPTSAAEVTSYGVHTICPGADGALGSWSTSVVTLIAEPLVFTSLGNVPFSSAFHPEVTRAEQLAQMVPADGQTVEFNDEDARFQRYQYLREDTTSPRGSTIVAGPGGAGRWHLLSRFDSKGSEHEPGATFLPGDLYLEGGCAFHGQVSEVPQAAAPPDPSPGDHWTDGHHAYQWLDGGTGTYAWKQLDH